MKSLVLLLVIGAGPTVSAQPSAEQWLRNVDSVRNAFEEAVLSARATEIADGKTLGSVDFDVYRKGSDRSVIVFRGGKNNGRRILNVGEKMWLLVPGATNPVPITQNQRLMGGAAVADVARVSFAQDYTARLRDGPESVDGRVCRVLDLSAKSARAPFPTVVLWYDEDAGVPMRLRFSLPSGREAKEVAFTKFGKASGKTVVTEMEVRDLLAPGARTVTKIEYLNYRPAKIEDKVFTPEGARAL